MADGKVDVIISDLAIQNIQKANAALEQTYGLILDINEESRGGKDSGRQAERLKRQQDELKVQKDVIKSQQALTDALNKNTEAKSKNNKETEKTGNLLTKTNARLIAYRKEYQKLLLKQELGHKLNVKELADLKKKEANLKRMEMAYAKVNRTMAQTSGVVRGTRHSFDSLGFSVAQITRESPAFINSMNTGFMAISNNIPIFIDELKRLQEQGNTTGQMLRKVGRALFSWQSLFSVGIVLLTLYGEKLINWIGEMINANKVINAQTEALKELEKVRVSGVKNAQSEIVTMKRLGLAVKDSTKPIEEREEILTEIRKRYGDDIQHLTDREILTNGLALAEEELTEAILERAIADAAAAKASEIASEIIDLRIKEKEQLEVLLEKQEGLKIANNETVKSVMSVREQQDMLTVATIGYDVAISDLTDTNNEMIVAQEKFNTLMEAAGLNVESLLTKVKKKNKATKEELELIVNSIAWHRANVKELIRVRDSFAWTGEEIQNQTKIIDDYNERINIMINGLESLKAIKSGVDLSIFEDIQDLPILTEPPGDPTPIIIAQLEAARSLANGIADLGSTLFDRRISQIEAEIQAEEDKYDILFALAEGDAEQKRLLAIQEEEDRQVLEKKKRKALKEQAIFNKSAALADIALNTAVAITKLPADGGLLGLAAIPIVVALGALQAATVLATPIPQFAEGGTMDKDGLAVVGDGGRREVIKNPDGSIQVTPDTDTLVSLKRGAQIYPSIDAFNLEEPTDLSNQLYSASIMTSLALTKKSLKADKVFNEKLLEAMLENNRLVKKQKLSVTNNSQRVDLGHDLYKMKYLS